MTDEITTVLEATSLDDKPQQQPENWPRKTYGEIHSIQPKGKEIANEEERELLNYPGVKPFEGREYRVPHPSDKTGNDKRIAIYNCWAANMVHCENGDYLVLPSEAEGAWQDDADDDYSSTAIYIRKYYVDIAKLIIDKAEQSTSIRLRMILSGTSGTGKSFFTKYFVWTLLHPPQDTVAIPDIIIWKNVQGGDNGCIYYLGRFYSVDKMRSFVGSSNCKDLVYQKNAWVIYDGEPPRDPPNCKCLVTSSPGNLYLDSSHVKQYHKGTFFNIYLPPWTMAEIMEVATTIHGVDSCGMADIITRYKEFGGIARYVLNSGYSSTDPTLKNPIKDALSMSSIMRALDDVGSRHIDHATTSGVIVHLIPDQSYRSYTYEWGSTHIMMQAFDTLFKITKREVECFIVTGEGLHLGTLYGLLFEPLFHRRITEQGYSGRIRKLKTGREMQGITARKRNHLGMTVDNLDISKYTIRRMKQNIFFYRKQIVDDCYNVPVEPNYEAVDSLCPARGEIFQITSKESHPIKTKNLTLLRPLFDDFLALNPSQKVKFIFVVPPDRFETYTTQTYVSPLAKKQKAQQRESKMTNDDPKAETSGDHTKEQRKKEAKMQAEKKKQVKKKITALKRKSKRESQEMKRKRLVAGEPVDKGEREECEWVENDDEDELEEAFDDSWLEQWVLEMNVDPLTDAIAARNLAEKKQKVTERIGVKRLE